MPTIPNSNITLRDLVIAANRGRDPGPPYGFDQVLNFNATYPTFVSAASNPLSNVKPNAASIDHSRFRGAIYVQDSNVLTTPINDWCGSIRGYNSNSLNFGTMTTTVPRTYTATAISFGGGPNFIVADAGYVGCYASVAKGTPTSAGTLQSNFTVFDGTSNAVASVIPRPASSNAAGHALVSFSNGVYKNSTVVNNLWGAAAYAYDATPCKINKNTVFAVAGQVDRRTDALSNVVSVTSYPSGVVASSNAIYSSPTIDQSNAYVLGVDPATGSNVFSLSFASLYARIGRNPIGGGLTIANSKNSAPNSAIVFCNSNNVVSCNVTPKYNTVGTSIFKTSGDDGSPIPDVGAFVDTLYVNDVKCCRDGSTVVGVLQASNSNLAVTNDNGSTVSLVMPASVTRTYSILKFDSNLNYQWGVGMVAYSNGVATTGPCQASFDVTSSNNVNVVFTPQQSNQMQVSLFSLANGLAASQILTRDFSTNYCNCYGFGARLCSSNGLALGSFSFGPTSLTALTSTPYMNVYNVAGTVGEECALSWGFQSNPGIREVRFIHGDGTSNLPTSLSNQSSLAGTGLCLSYFTSNSKHAWSGYIGRSTGQFGTTYPTVAYDSVTNSLAYGGPIQTYFTSNVYYADRCNNQLTLNSNTRSNAIDFMFATIDGYTGVPGPTVFAPTPSATASAPTFPSYANPNYNVNWDFTTTNCTTSAVTATNLNAGWSWNSATATLTGYIAPLTTPTCTLALSNVVSGFLTSSASASFTGSAAAPAGIVAPTTLTNASYTRMYDTPFQQYMYYITINANTTSTYTINAADWFSGTGITLTSESSASYPRAQFQAGYPDNYFTTMAFPTFTSVGSTLQFNVSAEDKAYIIKVIATNGGGSTFQYFQISQFTKPPTFRYDSAAPASTNPTLPNISLNQAQPASILKTHTLDFELCTVGAFPDPYNVGIRNWNNIDHAALYASIYSMSAWNTVLFATTTAPAAITASSVATTYNNSGIVYTMQNDSYNQKRILITLGQISNAPVGTVFSVDITATNCVGSTTKQFWYKVVSALP